MIAVPERQAIIVVDLSNGDCGKGKATDYFAERYGAHTVVRHSGSGNAGHNAVRADGRQHVFAHIGSAMFVPGVRSHLARTMLVMPLPLLAEAKHLIQKGVTDVLERLTVSADCVVITPFHRAANRLRESARSAGRHGSLGFGLGETVADSLERSDLTIRVGDLRDTASVTLKLRRVQEEKRARMAVTMWQMKQAGISRPEDEDWLNDPAWPAVIARAWHEFAEKVRIEDEPSMTGILEKPGTVIFEGSQGVLLDEWRGFHPYTTWSRTCNHNPHMLLDEYGYDGDRRTVGMLRAYGTRHGPGPFVTYDEALTAALPDAHNSMGEWQREFRVGWLDLMATRYAIAACARKVDELMITCLDRIEAAMPQGWHFCNAYDLSHVSKADREELFVTDNVLPWFGWDIKLGPHKDLVHQERLGKVLLRDVRPLLGTLQVEHLTSQRLYDEIADYVGEQCGVPVGHLSYGPTAGQTRSR